MNRKNLAVWLIVVLTLGASGPANAGNDVTVAGTWEGTYTCEQGRTAVTLRAVETDDTIEAFRPLPSGPDVPSGRFVLEGEPSSGESVDLAPKEWLERPEGFSMIGLDGSVSADGNTFEGELTGAGDKCTSFSLQRKGGPDSVDELDVDTRESQETSSETEDSADDRFEPVDDRGFHTDFHKKHVGEIVFSSTPIPKDDHSDFSPEHSFKLGEPIYHRTFLKASMGNLMRNRDYACRGTSQPSANLTMQLHIQIGDAPKSDWIEISQPLQFSQREFDTWTSTAYLGQSLSGTPEDAPYTVPSDQHLFTTFSSKVLPKLSSGDTPHTCPTATTTYAKKLGRSLPGHSP
ncbi:MAG: hypothetical protein ABEN55_08205 [Bradymonadaceae bacterium]